VVSEEATNSAERVHEDGGGNGAERPHHTQSGQRRVDEEPAENQRQNGEDEADPQAFARRAPGPDSGQREKKRRDADDGGKAQC
jgi:hypothetical protein